MIIYVDIDETICLNDSLDSSLSRDYAKSKPITKNISKINKLYDEGHTIIYWTARGTLTKVDWSDITKKQFSDWGVQYHQILFGKPHYDLFICDKSFNPKEWG
jgi:archaellum biogenesis ATPase FlaH